MPDTSADATHAGLKSPDSSVVSTSRVRLDVDERREQLLKVGIELFGSRAYNEVSIDDIASTAKMSKGLLYHYFPTKHAYYIAVIRSEAQRLLREIEECPKTDSQGALRYCLHVYFGYAERHAHGMATLLRGTVGGDRAVSAILEDLRSRITSILLSRTPFSATHTLYTLSVRGWVGMVEAMTFEWADKRAIAKEVLVSFLIEQLVSCLKLARQTVEKLEGREGAMRTGI